MIMLRHLRRWCIKAFELLTWAEVSGSLGDLGTFLPLLIALVQKVDLDLGTTLIVTGLYNIASGVQFGIPMCVQPMKTIAAVALAASQPSPLTLPQLLMGGVFVSSCVLLLGLTRLVDLFNWLIPPPVVRGVQLAVGAKLAMKGIDMALRFHLPSSPSSSSSSSPHWRPLLGCEGLLVGALALAALLATTMAPRVSSLGSPEAAEEEGVGPRPGDTPFEPLLGRLMPGRFSRQVGVCDGGGGGRGGGGPVGAMEASSLLCTSCRDTMDPELTAVYDVVGGGGGAGCQVGGKDDETVSGSGGNSGDGGGGGGVFAGCSSGSGGGGGICGGQQGFPSALVALVVGLVMAVASHPALLRELKLGPSIPRMLRPSWSDLREGALRAGLPQLPLTTLNSVIAVSHLGDSLFPDRHDSRRWRPASVALSVGLMNLLGCWLGAMPCCHGAGGLAAQYKFGARSGTAPMILGSIKAALGLIFGGSLAALLGAFPQPLLGALLVVSGVELASSVRHTRTQRGYSFAVVTAVAILGLDDTGTGFLLGLATVAVVAAYETASNGLKRRWGIWSSGGGDITGNVGTKWRWQQLLMLLSRARVTDSTPQGGTATGAGGRAAVYGKLADDDVDARGGAFPSSDSRSAL